MLYKRGTDKLRHELSVTNLVRAQRQSSFLCENLLEKKQRLMLSYQKKHMLQTDSSEESDATENLNLVNNLYHCSPFIRLLALGKVTKLIQMFEH